MCGIAGYVGNYDQSVLQGMTDKIAHRGPDGAGHWVGKEAGLGHRRLSIIDLSENALLLYKKRFFGSKGSPFCAKKLPFLKEIDPPCTS